jgi:hypothetical protein
LHGRSPCNLFGRRRKTTPRKVTSAAADTFEAFAREVSPEQAALVRASARDPFVLSLVPAEPTWDVPHRLLAAVEYLVLGGDAPAHDNDWPAFRAIVGDHAGWVEQFVRRQPIQTNEPQRCWALLPLFLTVSRAARKPLDLLELGTSADLNLLWDRYRYEYDAGSWGSPDSPLVLRGEERRPFLAELLDVDVEIRRRCGIDLAPVDATTEEGLRLLCSFTVREERRERVRRAAAVLRGDPPELVRGDYRELLPALLEERDDDAITVVFQTISTIYLPVAERELVREAIDRAAADGPLAWISTPTPEEHELEGRQYPLELALWPGAERRLVAEMANGGEWLDWWE